MKLEKKFADGLLAYTIYSGRHVFLSTKHIFRDLTSLVRIWHKAYYYINKAEGMKAEKISTKKFLKNIELNV